jgi:hypothetical protein
MTRNLQHVRNPIVDPRTGVPTKSFYDILNGLTVDSETNETILETIYQTTDFGMSGTEVATEPAAFDIKLAMQPDLSGDLHELRKLTQLKLDEIAAGATTYSAKGSTLLICNNTAAATITLNTSPFDGELLHVKRRDATVSFTGTVDGRTDFSIQIPYQAIKLIYTASAGEWSVI